MLAENDQTVSNGNWLKASTDERGVSENQSCFVWGWHFPQAFGALINGISPAEGNKLLHTHPGNFQKRPLPVDIIIA